MDRTGLINTTRAILAKAGFDVSSALTLRGICFDIVARRDDRVLIVKVLSNIVYCWVSVITAKFWVSVLTRPTR